MIKQIAERLRGLRESLNLTENEFATLCKVDVEKYIQYESGNNDISISALHLIAKGAHIELTSLLSGEDAHVQSYAITRKGQGVSLQRRLDYNYESLAYSFIHRKAEPFVVTVLPKPEDETLVFNTHGGQEFNYVLKGTLELFLGTKKLRLEEGDSIYFDPTIPHAMRASNGVECKFLALIIE